MYNSNHYRNPLSSTFWFYHVLPINPLTIATWSVHLNQKREPGRSIPVIQMSIMISQAYPIQKDARFDPAGFIDFPQGFDWFSRFFLVCFSQGSPAMGGTFPETHRRSVSISNDGIPTIWWTRSHRLNRMGFFRVVAIGTTDLIGFTGYRNCLETG